MSINKIRSAVMASRGLPDTVTDQQIMMVWNSLGDQTQKEYMTKIDGGKNVTSIDGRNLRGSTKRTRGHGKPPDISV